MKKLRKYTDFEALKSNVKSGNTIPKKDNKTLLEYDSFVKLLQREYYFNKRKTKTDNGK